MSRYATFFHFKCSTENVQNVHFTNTETSTENIQDRCSSSGFSAVWPKMCHGKKACTKRTFSHYIFNVSCWLHVAHPMIALALKSTQWNVTCQINKMNSIPPCVNWKGMQQVYAERIDKTDNKLYCLGYLLLSLITKELDGGSNANTSSYF